MGIDENVQKINEKINIRSFAEENKGLKEIEVDKNNFGTNYKEFCDNLEEVNKHYYINSYMTIKSHRKIIGNIIIVCKKVIRKLFKWYIEPMVKNQNIYNSDNTKTLNATKCIIENMNIKIENLYNIIQEKNEAISQMESIIEKMTEIDKGEIIKNVREELYLELYKPLLSQNNHDTNLRVYENILSKVNDESLLNEAVNEFERKIYMELNKYENNKKKNVVVLCKNFKIEGNIEAIKKEAYNLYGNLKEDLEYNTQFVSLEEQENIKKTENGIYFISTHKIDEHMKKINPDVIHIFESNVHILFSNECELLKYNIIFHVTGQDPFPGIDEWALDELRHLNDNSKIQFVVESKYAQQIFVKNNFKMPEVVYPIIDVDNVNYKVRSMDTFTIGFASSPMREEQMKNRGIYLLGEVIRKNPDINFKIAWRNAEVNVPGDIKSCENVEILYGKIDMNKFYEEIDCAIIPYISLEDNHACSLSALEALFRGIPVVSTEVSGVSDIIVESELGEVCDISISGIEIAIRKIKDNYNNYNKEENINSLKELFNVDKKLKYIKSLYNYFTNERVYMLKEWDWKLRENNKYLVKGNKNIKDYYSQQSIATSYHDDRFSSYPMNLYDAFERKAINMIINSQYITKDLNLMDIASGDGRILKELFKFGKCTSIDNSKEMLKIVINKYGDNEGLSVKKGDFLEIDIENKYEVITTFRYIRHFEYKERQIIYDKIRNSLDDNGIFIFDVPNIDVELKLREVLGWENFNIYDVFWSEDLIKLEAEKNGFEVKFSIPIGENLIEKLPYEYRMKPLSWVVGLVKK